MHDRPTIILGFTWSDTVSIFRNHPACSVTKIMWLSRAYSIVAIVYIVSTFRSIQYSFKLPQKGTSGIYKLHILIGEPKISNDLNSITKNK